MGNYLGGSMLPSAFSSRETAFRVFGLGRSLGMVVVDEGWL
jgi:hypothetical protein